MFRKWSIVILLLSLPTTLLAAPCSKFYLRAFSGVNFLSINAAETSEERVETEVGYIAGGAVGLCVSKTLRFEFEGAYRLNDLKKIVIENEDFYAVLDLKGDVTSQTYMVNAIFDLPFPGWSPYFGLGLGGIEERASFRALILEGTAHDVLMGYKQQEAAYQIIAGLNLASFFTLTGSVEYHFFDLMDTKNHNHSLAISLRKTF